MSTAHLSEQTAELKALLHHDLASLEELDDLLRQEQKALGANDMASLDALVARKTALLDTIRERARSKVRHLVALGFKPASGSPSSFLQGLEEQELTHLWHAAYATMQSCLAANNVNGQVINHLQKRAGRLSDIIRGVNNSQKLYGAAGREESVSHKSVLANA